MKLIADSEKENEKLDDVTFEQAQNLQKLGFDWNCGTAYDKDGNDVNWTTKQFYCWRPTVSLALRFMRKRYGIFHTMYVRSWEAKKFGFSVSHSLLGIDLLSCDLADKHIPEEERNYDGIISFDYDEAESRALDFAIAQTLENCSRDFSFLKPDTTAYAVFYSMGIPMPSEIKIVSVDEKLKSVKIEGEKGYGNFDVEFRNLYPTREEAQKICDLKLSTEQ